MILVRAMFAFDFSTISSMVKRTFHNFPSHNNMLETAHVNTTTTLHTMRNIFVQTIFQLDSLILYRTFSLFLPPPPPLPINRRDPGFSSEPNRSLAECTLSLSFPLSFSVVSRAARFSVVRCPHVFIAILQCCDFQFIACARHLM